MMLNKLRVLIILLIMVATSVVTILCLNLFKIEYENKINLSDLFSLLVSGLLAYYIGTTFVRSNEKQKNTRDYFIKEMLELINDSKIKFLEIKGLGENFQNDRTTLLIQSLRDRIEFLKILNFNFFNEENEENEIEKILDLISSKIASIDLLVNSGYGISDINVLEEIWFKYEDSCNDIMNDFASIFKKVS